MMSKKTKKDLAENQGASWWRTVIGYEIFPRSFADSNGDGIGDIGGITSKLDYLKKLGVGAIWITPFYPSPQKDAGYDISDYCNVSPELGTLKDFDRMIKKAHKNNIKVIIDIVPNHSSVEHPWFVEALKSPAGSKARERYMFRDGKGEHGELPPNNWESLFGGPAWQRVPGEKQWYMTLFSPFQPDYNWENPEVHEEFKRVLRFWLDRGVDGLRIDAANSLVKKEGLPDSDVPMILTPLIGPMWDQDGVHEIYREWRKLLSEYKDRAIIAEAWGVPTMERLGYYVRPDEMQQCFNFEYMLTEWSAQAYKSTIQTTLAGMDRVGAPSTWVTCNHDQLRIASRLGLSRPGSLPLGLDKRHEQPNEALGLRRARALIMMTMLLPGSTYFFQGEELGLPDHTLIEDWHRQDPRYFATNGKTIGRDGCRAPMPWNSTQPAFGFSTGHKTWLPQPDKFKYYAVDVEEQDEQSTLSLYRRLIELRKALKLASGELHWFESARSDVLTCRNRNTLLVINFGHAPVSLPKGRIMVQSQPEVVQEEMLEGNSAVWIELDSSTHNVSV